MIEAEQWSRRPRVRERPLGLQVLRRDLPLGLQVLRRHLLRHLDRVELPRPHSGQAAWHIYS
jgi:hypothetical protein